MKIYIVKWTFYKVKHTKPAIYNNQNFHLQLMISPRGLDYK